MPILHNINEQLGVVFSQYTGTVSDSDLIKSYEQLYGDNRWKPGFHEMVNLLEADVRNITPDALYKVSEMVNQNISGKCPEFKTAIIVKKSQSAFPAIVYQVMADNSPETVKLFEREDKALDWLDVTA